MTRYPYCKIDRVKFEDGSAKYLAETTQTQPIIMGMGDTPEEALKTLKKNEKTYKKRKENENHG